MKVNRIYAGPAYSLRGIDGTSSSALKKKLDSKESPSEFFSSESIAKLDGETALSTRIIFSGGICSRWDEDISLLAKETLKAFVENGSQIMGFCAGAYFWCGSTHYQLPDRLLEKDRKTHAFFKGRALGPLYENKVPGCEGYLPRLTTIRWFDGRVSSVLMAGGGYFLPSEEDVEGTTYEVLARYEDQPSEKSLAIIRCFHGRGSATLCFPHLEWDHFDTVSMLEGLRVASSARFESVLSEVEGYKKTELECREELEKLMK